MKLGAKIKQLRQSAGLTQAACAAAAGVAQSRWADLEADRHDPHLATLEKVAAALGVTLAGLFPAAPADEAGQ